MHIQPGPQLLPPDALAHTSLWLRAHSFPCKVFKPVDLAQRLSRPLALRSLTMLPKGAQTNTLAHMCFLSFVPFLILSEREASLPDPSHIYPFYSGVLFQQAAAGEECQRLLVSVFTSALNFASGLPAILS